MNQSKSSYSSDNINDWRFVGLVFVGQSVLFGDQTPQFVAVDGRLPRSVLEHTVLSHTDFTEVTRMAIKRKQIDR